MLAAPERMVLSYIFLENDAKPENARNPRGLDKRTAGWVARAGAIRG
jgi:hypothetical protein